MSAAVLETRALARRFGGVTALHALDLTVGAGESVAVFGPNGAGKSTLLRLLATLLRPSAGEVRLFTHAVRDGGAAARRRIGFLSHQSFLYPDLTPTENLDFYARMFHVPRRAERVRTLIERVGLGGWAHRPVRTLSRGLEQRCALARALVHGPDLLLLDEPFTGLDVDASAMLATMLRETHAGGTTLLMTTHDMARGFEVCERAVILTRGRLMWDGTIAATPLAEFTRRYHELVLSPQASARSTSF
jgi:heme ABC exporter ATP-binding subunit CcmA